MVKMCSQDKSLLERLGIRPEARSFFKNHVIETCEDIIFKYGNALEHVSNYFHLIPTTDETWTVGEITRASHIIICGSAMDAVAWLHYNRHAYQHNLFFAAVGTSPSQSQIEAITRPNKQYHLVFGSDGLGALCDLKAAAYLHRQPIKILAAEQHYTVTFRSKNYKIRNLSLHALEKAAGYHFNVVTHKPKKHNTYYEQLKHGHRT
jgi:hypothetical protein